MSDKTLFIQMTEDVEKLIQEIRDARINRGNALNPTDELLEALQAVTTRPGEMLQGIRNAALTRECVAYEALGRFVMMHLEKNDVDQIPF